MKFDTLEDEFLFNRVKSLTKRYGEAFRNSFVDGEEHISIAAMKAKTIVRKFADLYILPLLEDN